MRFMLYFLSLIFPLFLRGEAIAIFAAKVNNAKPWDPRTVQTGITGSEEAIIYMSQELVKLGHQVTVFADPPADSPYSAPSSNPRFLSTTSKDFKNFDIAISWRMPKIAPILKQFAKKVYLWPHDTCGELLTKEEIGAFDDVLWLSEWQRAQWSSVNPLFTKFTHIFGNGIELNQFHGIAKRKNPFSCIYASNYARGLEILLDIWPEVKRQYPKATLDIYYGWQHWGLLTEEKEKKMRFQIATMKDLGVEEHGLVGHEELNRAYEKASFWTYPCIAPETFCITALRAQMSGAIPVIIEGSALKETVLYGYRCYRPENYLNLLLQAMKEVDKTSLEERKKMGQFIHRRYTWKEIAKRWNENFVQPKAK